VTLHSHQPAVAIASSRSAVVLSAALALSLGVFVLFGVGFAQPDLLHNAAHDTRHAFTFPCH
jgi:cobalt transporter subunit CbtB